MTSECKFLLKIFIFISIFKLCSSSYLYRTFLLTSKFTSTKKLLFTAEYTFPYKMRESVSIRESPEIFMFPFLIISEPFSTGNISPKPKIFIF